MRLESCYGLPVKVPGGFGFLTPFPNCPLRAFARLKNDVER